MNILSGETLQYLFAPPSVRGQMRRLMDFLDDDKPHSHSVCMLYGLLGTGKTTLLIQAIQSLLHDGTDPESICYITGQKGDTLDDLIAELESRKALQYVFIDEISAFCHLLNDGDYLYTTLVQQRSTRVVITGNNILTLYLLGKQVLNNRCHVIRLPHLSYTEHRALVLENPCCEHERFLQYLRYGGLFHLPADVRQYVDDSIVSCIPQLFDNEYERHIFAWLRPEQEYTDWSAYVHTLLLLLGNHKENATCQLPKQLRNCYRQIGGSITENLLIDFWQYFGMTPEQRRYRMRRTVTVALLEFFEQSGIVKILQTSRKGNEEMYRCFIQMPCIRYYYADRMRQLIGESDVDDKAFMDKQAEAMLICRSQSADTNFWQRPEPPQTTR